MKVTLSFSMAALVSLVSSTALNLNKRDSPIVVTLESIGNTEVKATVTNTGSTGYNLFSKGTVLDTAHNEKLQVFSANSKVAFEGVRQRLMLTDIPEELFTPIGAGESITVTVELAELHDLSAGGAFDVIANGAISYAELGSTELTGEALTYSSNTLSLSVDGVAASKIPRAVQKDKRTVLSSDCTGTKLTALRTDFSNCVSLANAAATAASSGSSTKFSEYFKTTSTSSRSSVAARFRAIASDCGSTTSGSTSTHCTDAYGYCTSGVLAYTLPASNYIVYCNLMFTALSGLSRTCHAQDQTTTVIHELTHAPGVYSPGTDDHAYGYSSSVALSSSQALDNADNYALYANAIYVGC